MSETIHLLLSRKDQMLTEKERDLLATSGIIVLYVDDPSAFRLMSVEPLFGSHHDAVMRALAAGTMASNLATDAAGKALATAVLDATKPPVTP